jgi:selenocysteine lyase/cysteine desulfurase
MPFLEEPSSVEKIIAASGNGFAELERSIREALVTYSNVHRGTGQDSMVSTELFEQAREIVLEYLGLNRQKYTVIFCSPHRAEILTKLLGQERFHILSSEELHLPLGIRAVAAEIRSLPSGVPFQTGGGTVKIVSPDSVLWADPPDKFEAGTPMIINAIALARALQLVKSLGPEAFVPKPGMSLTAKDILYHDEFEQLRGRNLLMALRASEVGFDESVPTDTGFQRYIHFDNSASTPTFEPIWQAVNNTWQQPESVWTEIAEETKEIVADFFGASLEGYDVVFASNTTEALNTAAELIAGEMEVETEPVVLNTLLEHNSNELPWRYHFGLTHLRLHVDDEGFVDLQELEALLSEYNHEHAQGKKRIRLVAVSGESNVLGAFNDLAAISRLAHQYGARMLVDAAQCAAHRQVEMEAWNIDYLAFSAHKMYAPFGSGGLVLRRSLRMPDMDSFARLQASGDENAAGIAALGKAMLLLRRIGLNVIEEEERALTRCALQGMSHIPGIQIFGVTDPNSPRLAQRGGVIGFTLQHVPYNLVGKELAEYGGIGVRCGCFCAHLLVKHLLGIHPFRARAADLGLILNTQFTSSILPGIVRVGFGIQSTPEQVDELIRVIEKIGQQPRSAVDRLIGSLHNGTPFLPQTKTQKQMSDFVHTTIKKVYA